jgi:peptidoglycan hydrolase FlgJ
MHIGPNPSSVMHTSPLNAIQMGAANPRKVDPRLADQAGTPMAADSQAAQLSPVDSDTPGERADSSELQEVFQDFVGQTFFSEMIKSMRSTQNPPAYFHGGQAEKIFQGQFDQIMAEELSDSSAAQFSDPMFELFMLKRQP